MRFEEPQKCRIKRWLDFAFVLRVFRATLLKPSPIYRANQVKDYLQNSKCLCGGAPYRHFL